MIQQQKILKAVVIIIVIIGLAVPAALALAQIDQSFNPSLLIEDKVFTDTQTFGGASGIQKFLEQKGSILANTSQDFLLKLREPSFVDLKTKLEDPQPNLGRLRTAAELIWDSSQAAGINPQVILVTMQKEQGLITNTPSPERFQRALDIALGFGCPDNQPCSKHLEGFYFQLFGAIDQDGDRWLGAARSMMRAFNVPIGQPVITLGGKPGVVGQVYEFSNTVDPYGVPASQQVLLSNRATAVLYRYTPHVFNGNYNFWKYFNQWFKYPNGTIMAVGGSQDRYIIQNGSRFLLPAFVAKARGLDVSQAITVSPLEVENYPAEKNPLGPSDDTIISVSGVALAPPPPPQKTLTFADLAANTASANEQTQPATPANPAPSTAKFVFINNVKHPASDFVIRQRKLDPGKSLSITASEAELFPSGPQLTPSDGTILRGVNDKAVYAVENGQLRAFSAFTFQQRKITAKQVSTIPDSEVESYPKAGFIPPLNGTVLKSANNHTVFEIVDGTKKPFSFELFKNRQITPKQIAVLSDGEVEAVPMGAGFPKPAEKSFYIVKESQEQYFVRDGQMHRLLPLVIKQQKITPDFTFSLSEHLSWPKGQAISPREGTIVKGDKSDAVYMVNGKKLRPLTFQAFKNRKITPKQISVIPEAEVAEYEKGDVVEK